MACTLVIGARLKDNWLVDHDGLAPGGVISVFLADDNLIVREGVRALIERSDGLKVVRTAADYDEVVSGCAATEPQVLVTDVRMPLSYSREGIDAAKEVADAIRPLSPGTGRRGSSCRSRC